MSDSDDGMQDHGDDMKDDDIMMDDEKKDDAMMDEKDDGMAEGAMVAPEWFSTELTNAHTGESFVVADFEGKVVLVETLAMWCSNCRKQQGEVQTLHDLLGERDDFVSLGIDIDPNENAEALQAYIDNHGFDWLYTVAPSEVSREIGQLYGDQYLNPPSTPMLIIDREGKVHLLPFGIKSAKSLLESLQPFLDEEL
jgi:thiol-disulfide isomerase/thioredoxin